MSRLPKNAATTAERLTSRSTAQESAAPTMTGVVERPTVCDRAAITHEDACERRKTAAPARDGRETPSCADLAVETERDAVTSVPEDNSGMVDPVFSDQGPLRPTVRRTGRSACRRRALRGRLTRSS